MTKLFEAFYAGFLLTIEEDHGKCHPSSELVTARIDY
jgi:hypothetical protein